MEDKINKLLEFSRLVRVRGFLVQYNMKLSYTGVGTNVGLITDKDTDAHGSTYTVIKLQGDGNILVQHNNTLEERSVTTEDMREVKSCSEIIHELQEVKTHISEMRSAVALFDEYPEEFETTKLLVDNGKLVKQMCNERYDPEKLMQLGTLLTELNLE